MQKDIHCWITIWHEKRGKQIPWKEDKNFGCLPTLTNLYFLLIERRKKAGGWWCELWLEVIGALYAEKKRTGEAASAAVGGSSRSSQRGTVLFQPRSNKDFRRWIEHSKWTLSDGSQSPWNRMLTREQPLRSFLYFVSICKYICIL